MTKETKVNAAILIIGNEIFWKNPGYKHKHTCNLVKFLGVKVGEVRDT